jgi:hypothetical protein
VTSERTFAYRERLYNALKMHDPQLYLETIETAEATILAHGLDQSVAVHVEVACVYCVCRALHLDAVASGGPPR